MSEAASPVDSSPESATERLRFAVLVTAAVILLTVSRLYFHEFWRDEAWLWMVVGDSSSLAEMAANLARNGQGFFFPSLLYLAREVWPSPRAMQLVNLVLAGCGAFAFARRAPFGKAERALVVFGYLPFYEYAVISRHYAAGQFLLWLACAAALASPNRRWSPAAFGLALGLLCQTTVYGYILALALAAGWLVLQIFPAPHPPTPLSRGREGAEWGAAPPMNPLMEGLRPSGSPAAAVFDPRTPDPIPPSRTKVEKGARGGETPSDLKFPPSPVRGRGGQGGEGPDPLAPRSWRWPLLAGTALFLIGAIAGMFQLIPEPGTSFAPGWRFGWEPAILERVLQMPWRAFVLAPRLGLHFWNSNLLDPWPALQAAAGVLVFAGATVLLWPRKAALAAWLVGAAGLAGFGYIKYVGVVRHDGHWWLLFLAALWLAGGLPPGGWRRAAFWTLLVLHAAVAVYASGMDLRHPFSNAAATAELIRDRGYDRLPLLGYREPPAAPVVLALGRPIFFPSRGVYAKYPDWGPVMHEMADPELRCAARAFAAAEGSDIVIIRNGLLPPWPEVEELAAVTGAIQATEDYHLYRLFLGRLAPTSAEAACPAATSGYRQLAPEANTAGG